MAAVPKTFQSKSYHSVGIEIVYPKKQGDDALLQQVDYGHEEVAVKWGKGDPRRYNTQVYGHSSRNLFLFFLFLGGKTAEGNS